MTAFFEAVHPTGGLLFRSSRGGAMDSVHFDSEVLTTFPSALALARGILLTERVSRLKAVMEIREELIAAGTPPSAAVATRDDLATAEMELRNDRPTN